MIESGGWIVDPRTGECVAPRIVVEEQMLKPMWIRDEKRPPIHWFPLALEDPAIPLVTKTFLEAKRLVKELGLRREVVRALVDRKRVRNARKILDAFIIANSVIEHVWRRPTRLELMEAWTLLKRVGIDEGSRVWTEEGMGIAAALAALSTVMGVPTNVVMEKARELGVPLNESLLKRVLLAISAEVKKDPRAVVMKMIDYLANSAGVSPTGLSLAKTIASRALSRRLSDLVASPSLFALASLTLATAIIMGYNGAHTVLVEEASYSARMNAEIEVESLAGIYTIANPINIEEVWMSEELCRAMKRLGIKPFPRVVCFEGDLRPYAGIRIAAREMLLLAISEPERLKRIVKALEGGLSALNKHSDGSWYIRFRATHVTTRMLSMIASEALRLAPRGEGSCPLCGKNYPSVWHLRYAHIREIEKLIDEVLDRVAARGKAGD